MDKTLNNLQGIMDFDIHSYSSSDGLVGKGMKYPGLKLCWAWEQQLQNVAWPDSLSSSNLIVKVELILMSRKRRHKSSYSFKGAKVSMCN